MSITPTGGATAAPASAPPTNTATPNGAAPTTTATTTGSPVTIVSTTSVTNGDGSVTTTTTYGDGSTVVTTQPAPPSANGNVPSLLNPNNFGQGSTLLAAQEHANQP
jgi:hypothetical protein